MSEPVFGLSCPSADKRSKHRHLALMALHDAVFYRATTDDAAFVIAALNEAKRHIDSILAELAGAA
jgi:hypothetical protein